ncbi:MAG: hypothetical protein FWD89_03365 [Firmicutes bacterium]|nr:hypothetical protein [Bacillota bacterium]MCL2771329.1 hypothetical protein [Bacillota bacterium]
MAIGTYTKDEWSAEDKNEIKEYLFSKLTKMQIAMFANTCVKRVRDLYEGKFPEDKVIRECIVYVKKQAGNNMLFKTKRCKNLAEKAKVASRNAREYDFMDAYHVALAASYSVNSLLAAESAVLCAEHAAKAVAAAGLSGFVEKKEQFKIITEIIWTD